MKPITLWSHTGGPNPWKVAIILKELNVPYESKFIDFKQVKEEPFLSLNPNGRVPAIEDPNTGLTLWESGAIVEYIIDQYDTEHKISHADLQNKNHARQWLHFQMSGQGPYYGQAFWFINYAPEKIPYAIDRYVAEMGRVTSVLEKALDGKDWLVGDKCTYADLAFVPWQRIAGMIGGENFYDKYPKVKAWLDRMQDRPSVKKIDIDQAAAKKADAEKA